MQICCGESGNVDIAMSVDRDGVSNSAKTAEGVRVKLLRRSVAGILWFDLGNEGVAAAEA